MAIVLLKVIGMKRLLVINSSTRMLNSHSRKLTEVFVEHWRSIHADSIIHFRELGNIDVPHINENWIAAAFKSETMRSDEEMEILKTSNVYVAELVEADIIVLGAPMYNWSIPSSLKAWIDQVMRVNETFTVNPADTVHPYTGLLQHKTLFLLLSSGFDGYEQGGHNEHLNFQSRYLKTVFEFMGITQIHVIAISGASINIERYTNTMELAQQSIKELTDLQEA